MRLCPIPKLDKFSAVSNAYHKLLEMQRQKSPPLPHHLPAKPALQVRNSGASNHVLVLYCPGRSRAVIGRNSQSVMSHASVVAACATASIKPLADVRWLLHHPSETRLCARLDQTHTMNWMTNCRSVTWALNRSHCKMTIPATLCIGITPKHNHVPTALTSRPMLNNYTVKTNQ